MPRQRFHFTFDVAAPAAAAPAFADVAAAPSGAAAPVLRPHDPRLTPRDEAVYLLHAAAEVEHALLVQYLYAAYSLNPDNPDLSDPQKAAAVAGWKGMVVQIAREEMAHLASVQNLLHLIGGPLAFEREDFPFRSDLYPFPFRLEPLTRRSLAKYVSAERPEQVGDHALRQLWEKHRATIERLAHGSGGLPVNRVGALYQRLRLLFGDPAETGFPGDIPLDLGDFRTDVARLLAAPADWGAAGDAALIVAPYVAPGSPEATDPQRLREQGLDALHRVAAQGEGYPEPPAGQKSHFERFLVVFDQYQALFGGLPDDDDPPAAGAPAGRATGPGTPAWRVPVDPSTDPQAGPSAITNPRSRLWAQLLNLRYRLLLGLLEHYFSTPSSPAPPGPGDGPNARTILLGWIHPEMALTIATVGKRLVGLPQAGDAGPESGRAGPPFELPYALRLPAGDLPPWRTHRDVIAASLLLLPRLRQAEKEQTGSEDPFLTNLIAQDTAMAARLDELLGRMPPVTDVKEIRLLPPLAFGRLGSSPSPMDNYHVALDDGRGYRRLEPAETLHVDRLTGRITSRTTPDAVRFRDDSPEKRIRPVAPFLEVWARFTDDGPLVPLTARHLQGLGLSAAALRWRVRAANWKAARRTGQKGDRVEADTGTFTDHAVHFLNGTAANFKPTKAIRFGDVQYIQPTAEFPEIRLRFTPAAGKVYGPKAGDPSTADDVYDASKGTWDKHNERLPRPEGEPPRTAPPLTYARLRAGPQAGRSLGYLDDTCDGWVEVTLTVGTKPLTALARIAAGPPDFAPDSFHVRSLADDLRQMLDGPEVSGEVTAEQVQDVVRRALETMRLMNTAYWNQEYADGPFSPEEAAWGNAVKMHSSFLQLLRDGLGAPAGSEARGKAVAALRRIRDVLRQPAEAANRTPAVMRKMPALMRGGDGGRLALSRRQVSLIDRAIIQFDQPGPVLLTPEQAMIKLIQDLGFGAPNHLGISVGPGQTLNQLFATPPDLLNYLRQNNAKGSLAGDVAGTPLVVPHDPDNSAFVKLISRTNPPHPMNQVFQNYRQGTKDGITIAREWIASL